MEINCYICIISKKLKTIPTTFRYLPFPFTAPIMKLIHLVIFLFFANNSYGQLPGFSLIDETSTWQVTGVSALPNGFHCNQGVEVDITFRTYFISGDTTISGNNYLKMFAYDIDSSYCVADPNIYWLDTVTNFVRLIREEENKILTFNETTQTESILWNYDSINIGDNLNSSCTISTIDTLYLLEQPYLKYHCDCGEDFIIQGVGTSQTFFSPPNCGTVFGGDWTNLCYQKNGFNIQIDPDAECISTGDTSIYVSTNNLKKEIKPKIFPNPTENIIHIAFNQSWSGISQITSIDGKRLLFQQHIHVNTASIDFSNFKNGIYILHLQSSDGKISFHKIVKNKND